jgi:hypothetical protein
LHRVTRNGVQRISGAPHKRTQGLVLFASPYAAPRGLSSDCLVMICASLLAPSKIGAASRSGLSAPVSASINSCPNRQSRPSSINSPRNASVSIGSCAESQLHSRPSVRRTYQARFQRLRKSAECLRPVGPELQLLRENAGPGSGQRRRDARARPLIKHSLKGLRVWA